MERSLGIRICSWRKDMEKKIDSPKISEGYAILPKKELKCIWMSAGLIAYKLCKYNLQCDRCPLDWELRNISTHPLNDLEPFGETNLKLSEEAEGSPSPKEEGKGEGFLAEALFEIREDLFYHSGHTWIEVEKAEEVRIGIDPFLANLLREVRVVILPLPGRRRIQGEDLCSIIQEGGISHILCPLSGIILSVNQRLKEEPDLICRDPLGEGFLVTMKPKNFQRDQKSFLFGEEAFSWYKDEWKRFREMVISHLTKNPHQEALGNTMQDGGELLQEIKNLMEPSRYLQLINHFLRRGERPPSRSKHRVEIES